ncbi:hypothetical protein AOPFMNJM_1750 [Methylobacterium jeotgali]|uniref:Flp family type IVb pilin n=2 Tax=Methylobacteriaceae TaxID=119045 RepID=A0ABQ4STB5_9HYPH|nr:hypothetical protein AOPFMNJM_1750 [Methylobacterium jeotgali]
MTRASASGRTRMTPRPSRWLARFAGDTGGATAIEYALIAGLVFLGIAGSLKAYGAGVGSMYDKIITAISQVM